MYQTVIVHVGFRFGVFQSVSTNQAPKHNSHIIRSSVTQYGEILNLLKYVTQPYSGTRSVCFSQQFALIMRSTMVALLFPRVTKRARPTRTITLCITPSK